MTKPLSGSYRYEGYIPDLIDKIADKAGFKYKIRMVMDARYGERTQDGRWNGMIGDIVRGVRSHQMFIVATFLAKRDCFDS